MKEKIMTVERFKKEVGVSITTKMNGKMSGMQSLSTSCRSNTICQARSKDSNSICSKCYAQRQLKMYKNADECFTRNAGVLCNRVLNKSELPVLNVGYFRLEAFSDLQNETQLINYFNLCRVNNNVKFGLWSKNDWIIENVINMGHKKPKNLSIVLSSPYLNKVANFNQYSWVDHVFTVYDKEYIEENDIDINCGAKSCITCLRCYKKYKKDFYINEKLK